MPQLQILDDSNLRYITLEWRLPRELARDLALHAMR